MKTQNMKIKILYRNCDIKKKEMFASIKWRAHMKVAARCKYCLDTENYKTSTTKITYMDQITISSTILSGWK
jgi:hypothetical protein